MSNINLPGEWLIIGSGSLVGSRFIELVSEDVNLYGAGGEIDQDNPRLKQFYSVDITDPNQVLEAIKSFPGEYIINFAGATLVDEIEKTRPQNPFDQKQLEQNIAYKVNVLGTRNIVEACRETGKFPVFISTGFVFDGKNGPYQETDPIAKDPDEISWYAWTKVLAELEVGGSGIRNLVIRISYPFRSAYEEKLDFARTFLKLYDEVKTRKRDAFYPIFADQSLTPTFIDDLPAAVSTLTQQNAEGLYHLGSPSITSPYEFCCELLKVARKEQNPEIMVPIGSLVNFQNEHPEIAKRPLKGGEKVDKITKLGFTPTSWSEGIKKSFG